MKLRCLAALVLTASVIVPSFGPTTVAGQTPSVTFTRDLAPILYAKCVTCHRPGEVAPMPLRTFEETRPFARAIKDNVVSRRMPPWSADRTIGHFTNDPSLSAQQIETITRWVDSGAPQGDARDLPPPPEFADGWQLGEPDLVVELPVVQVPARGRDIFLTPTVKLNLQEDRWIRAVEVRPGNRAVSHHAVLFGGAQGLLASANVANVLAVWAVGTPPATYPDGMGRWLHRGEAITANLHYHPNGTATTDRTRVGFFFGRGELKKEVVTAVGGNVTFEIPPNTAGHELRGVYVADQDITAISFFPHMHVRGTDMKMTATFPDGRQQVLLNVPRYDFNWQLFYYPVTPTLLPRGTRVDVVAHFDNTAANRANPNPDKRVTFGETTADEMMFGTFEFIAKEGVSPRKPDDRMRLGVIISSFPRAASYLMTAPSMLGTMNAALHLPPTGDGMWYLAIQPGVVIDLPVRQIAWKGNAFTFTADLKLGGLGGVMNVSGEVGEDGAIRGTVAPPARGLVPFRTFSGARIP